MPRPERWPLSQIPDESPAPQAATRGRLSFQDSPGRGSHFCHLLSLSLEKKTTCGFHQLPAPAPPHLPPNRTARATWWRVLFAETVESLAPGQRASLEPQVVCGGKRLRRQLGREAGLCFEGDTGQTCVLTARQAAASLCPGRETGQATAFSQVLGPNVAALQGPWGSRQRGSAWGAGIQLSLRGVGMRAKETAQENSLLAVCDAEPGLGGRQGGSCSHFKWERRPLCREATNPGQPSCYGRGAGIKEGAHMGPTVTVRAGPAPSPHGGGLLFP